MAGLDTLGEFDRASRKKSRNCSYTCSRRVFSLTNFNQLNRLPNDCFRLATPSQIRLVKNGPKATLVQSKCSTGSQLKCPIGSHIF